MAESVRMEAASALYSDWNSKALLETLSIQTPPHNLRLGLSRRHLISGQNPASTLAGSETGVTLTGDLTSADGAAAPFTVTPRIGWLGAESSAIKTTSRWLGVGLSFWTGEDTTRWTLDLQQTSTNSDAIDVTDIDGRRILSPDRINGTSTGVSWLHLATPEFLWKGSVSTIHRDDRPEVYLGKLEARYFVVSADAAVRGTIAQFENRGKVAPVTLTGSISATTIGLEWHQKLGDRMILAPGYRWYREAETPRAENGAQKIMGSDQIYASVRYRFWKDYWLEDASDCFISVGTYKTNTNLKIWHLAAGIALTQSPLFITGRGQGLPNR